jgi:hypothetical protein
VVNQHDLDTNPQHRWVDIDQIVFTTGNEDTEYVATAQLAAFTSDMESRTVYTWSDMKSTHNPLKWSAGWTNTSNLTLDLDDTQQCVVFLLNAGHLDDVVFQLLVDERLQCHDTIRR